MGGSELVCNLFSIVFYNRETYSIIMDVIVHRGCGVLLSKEHADISVSRKNPFGRGQSISGTCPACGEELTKTKQFSLEEMDFGR